MHDYEIEYYEKKRNDIRNSEYYRAMKKYILRNFEKDEIIPLDFRGRLRLGTLANIQADAPYGSEDCFSQLIVDLVTEGIIRAEHSLGREWYVKLTEKEVKDRVSSKKEIDREAKKTHISRKKKKQNQKVENERKSTKTYDGR